MGVSERLVDNGGVAIRYLESDNFDDSKVPVVFVPGIVDRADDYEAAIDCFGDRRMIVVEMRGRGGSDAPPSGYSPGEQAGDVEAVMQHASVSRFHLMTFSRGTTPGLELAFRNPGRVLSISIGDYPPAEIALSPDLVGNLLAQSWRGTPNTERVARHAMEGIGADSRDRQFWDQLRELRVPVLVARGSEGGLIDDRRESRYRQTVTGVEVVTIPGSGHDLFRPSRTAYPAQVMAFIERRCPST